MIYKVITNITDFRLLEQEWNILFETRIYSVFQSFTFNYSSWKYVLSDLAKNKLFIIKIIDVDTTIGFFPLYIDEKNRVRFINDVNADFCDIILSIKIDLTYLFQFILNDCKQKRIQLINLKEDSILTQFKSSKYKIKCAFIEKYTELQVDKGIFPNNCNKLLYKERGEIRRINRKNVNIQHTLLNINQADFPKKEILELKKKMIQDGIRNNDFLPLNQLNLIENLFNNNQLEISLTKDSKIRAILFIINNRNNSLLWIDLYDKRSYTSTLYNYISFISAKSFDSDICINFGRGAYKWKMSKFRPDVGDLFQLNIFSNNWLYVNHIIISYILDTLTFIYRRFK